MEEFILIKPNQLKAMLVELLDERLNKIIAAKGFEAPLDKKATCKYLGISISTLEKLMKIKEIKYFTIGNQPRFTLEEIDIYIKRKLAESN